MALTGPKARTPENAPSFYFHGTNSGKSVFNRKAPAIILRHIGFAIMQKTKSNGNVRRRQRGNAIVEFALVAPMLFALMLAIFDSGLYVYSFISVQSAARSAALRNSGSPETATDSSAACSIAANQLQGLPSMGSFSGSCSAAPLIVTSILCQTNSCGSAAASADGTESAVVTVKYSVPAMFGFPIAGPPVITASSQMKLRSIE